MLIVAVGVLVIGLATGFGSEPSAEPTAQAFLLAWQQQHYAAAGALTSASPGTAAADLKNAFAQLDATQLFLTMDSVTQHGGTAEASFTATVDLAEEGRVWTYHGRFGLSKAGGTWTVQWAPSVVYPGLGQGQRLAVVTQFPDRAAVLDAKGQPLQVPSLVYVVGVMPSAPDRPGRDGRPLRRRDRAGCRAGPRPDQRRPAERVPQARLARSRDLLRPALQAPRRARPGGSAATSAAVPG